MDDKVRIRIAEPTDVEVITDVLITSMPADRDWWDYRCPHRAQYPQDHRQYFRQLVQAWLSPEYEDWLVVVAETLAEGTGTMYQVGAYSTWDISYRNYRKFGSGYKPRHVADAFVHLPPRRDTDQARTQAYSRASEEGHAKLPNARYGTEQIHLQALGTHPLMTRRGLARRLCHWGMGQAAMDGVVATLLAAPLARAVYPRFGFVELGEVEVQVEGEEQRTFLYPMVWGPRSACSLEASSKSGQVLPLDGHPMDGRGKEITF